MTNQVPFRTRAITRAIREIKNKQRRAVTLRQGQVVATQTSTMDVHFIDSTVVIRVRCIGWGTISMPAVGSYVWLLDVEDGAPIAIGTI